MPNYEYKVISSWKFFFIGGLFVDTLEGSRGFFDACWDVVMSLHLKKGYDVLLRWKKFDQTGFDDFENVTVFAADVTCPMLKAFITSGGAGMCCDLLKFQLQQLRFPFRE